MQVLLIIDIPFVFIILISLGAFFIGYFFSPGKRPIARSNEMKILEKPVIKLQVKKTTEETPESIVSKNSPIQQVVPEPVEPKEDTILDYKTVHPGQIRATQTRARGGKFVGTEKKRKTSTESK